MEKVSMFKGKQQMFFMVSKEKGKHILKNNKLTMVCNSGGPINLNIVTAECDFDRTVSYPYSFTLMIANMNHGPQGFGTFKFSVFTTNNDTKVTLLPVPSN